MSDLLLTRQRQDVIRDRLAADGRVVAAALAREFRVSEDTVRRDLREMAAAGLCERVYGGALPVAPSTGTLVQRQGQDGDAKRALARAAAGFLTGGMTIFIDAGSTNAAVAAALPSGGRFTVVTNAPAIAMAIIPRAGVETVLVGGRYDPVIGACLGARAVSDAEGFRADLMILGACGIDARAGITAFSQDEAEFKRRVAAAAGAVMVVATRDKLGTAAPFAVLPVAGLTRLVTDAGGDETLLGALAHAGTDIVRVPLPR
ncbi:DeoR/GlpR family DNA-binding transcription regulator [Aureimonas sp. AU12]|uniref:DeoR/GlpR family DNA-binding transcription regulator n=1 Tax=Aureimonas sp. AU12 TaxID=1638161 RepID=UPI000785A3F5|nr:DeoR/GlpR family DNA-binding transcription regulator [Aureimonas sp. AU12]